MLLLAVYHNIENPNVNVNIVEAWIAEKIKIMTKITLDDDFQTYWFGMGDYEINLTIVNKVIRVIYVSEPPFGDSYHKLYVDDIEFKGFVWGCEFLFPFNQEYLICSWMKGLYQRKTIIINLINLNYHILPISYESFKRQKNYIYFESKLLNKSLALDLNNIQNIFN
ncbi:hypothetical protein ACFQ48_16595 [Hymenobacter caeli]|uniref:Uncharacterized protein n=1 Tax=Hymenobacter caeli TaxID=2735894 RepID=A0ABX2FTW2_9BACT|nr:hypothetical protein [Hymenobacter caeli]NRT20638.1 hypothetical protein [Hymenobacter caeli]